MNKETKISFRITLDDKALFQQMAAEANLSIGEFFIRAAKQAPPPSKQTQARLARQLCVHTNLVDTLTLSEEDRQAFHKWEEETWPYLK